jgi:hypothetical protein
MHPPLRPAISMIVPLYTKASHITRRFESIGRQTFADFEALKYAYQLTTIGTGDALMRLLRTEKFGRLLYAFQACLLRCLAAFLPLRVVAALNNTPAASGSSLRQRRILETKWPVPDLRCLGGRDPLQRVFRGARPGACRQPGRGWKVKWNRR